MKRAYRIVLAGWGIVAGLFFMLANVSPAGAFSITPVSYVASIERGGEQVFTLSVVNDAAVDARYDVAVIGVEPDEQGRPHFSNFSSDPVVGWTSLDATSSLIAAHAKKNFIFTVRVPADAMPGSHYFAVAAEAETSPGQIGVHAKAASLVTIHVAGEVTESVTIAKFEKLNSGQGDGSYVVRLHNGGDVEVQLDGSIAVTNIAGKKIYAQEVSLGNMLLAGADRVEKISLPPQKDFSLLPSEKRITFSVEYGISHQKTQITILEWVFPWPFKMLLAVIVIAGVGLVVQKYATHKK